VKKIKFTIFTTIFVVLVIFIGYHIFDYYTTPKYEEPIVPVCENPMDINSTEFKNLALKNFLKAYHKRFNITLEDYKKWQKSKEYYYLPEDEKINNRIHSLDFCGGNRKPDNGCEFYSLNKKINLDYFIDLSNKICVEDRAIDNAINAINKDDFEMKLIYPWDDNDTIISSDNKLAYNIVFSISPKELDDLISEIEFEEKDDKVFIYSKYNLGFWRGLRYALLTLYEKQSYRHRFCKQMFEYKNGDDMTDKEYMIEYFIVDKCGNALTDIPSHAVWREEYKSYWEKSIEEFHKKN